jgi:hypothetical protein
MAGFVLANGSMSSNQSGEGEIRRASSRPTSSTAWSRCPASSSTDADPGLPVVPGHDRVHRELTDDDLQKITHLPRTGADAKGRGPVRRRTRLLQVRHHRRDRRARPRLTPGRYVGAEEVEDDGDPFEEKMPRLVAELHAQFAESAKLEPTPRRAKSHRGGAWGAGRQDRVEPADERDAGGDGAGAVPELVRGFRPRGTTVLHLSAAAIPSYVFAVPVSHISEVYSERVSPIFRKIDENTKQSRTLATLRDTLLPKLLSGELSVAALKESMP